MVKMYCSAMQLILGLGAIPDRKVAVRREPVASVGRRMAARNRLRSRRSRVGLLQGSGTWREGQTTSWDRSRPARLEGDVSSGALLRSCRNWSAGPVRGRATNERGYNEGTGPFCRVTPAFSTDLNGEEGS